MPRATVRYSSTNPTLGVKYKPIQDVSLRASFAKAFLPPTNGQLLPNAMVNVNGDIILDPKHPAAGPYPVNTITGGNASLIPQRSKTWLVGFIFEPQEDVLEGLRIDLEHYEITQHDFIVQPTGNQILADPALANRVTRSSVTGLVTQIDESYINANEYRTEGSDLTLAYRKITSIGTFHAEATATDIKHEYRQLTSGQALLDFVGFPGENSVEPGEAKWKGVGTIAWTLGGWSARWTARWYGSYRQVGAPGDPYGVNTTITAAQGSYTIPSQTYHDVFVSYSFDSKADVANRLLSGATIQLGVQNVFNTLPPFDAYFQPFYYSPYGDVRLRQYWISLRKAFQ